MEAMAHPKDRRPLLIKNDRFERPMRLKRLSRDGSHQALINLSDEANLSACQSRMKSARQTQHRSHRGRTCSPSGLQIWYLLPTSYPRKMLSISI